MRRFLSSLLMAFALVAPAAAAERTLLSPLGPQSTLSTTPAAAAGLGALYQAATARGHVKVIVGLRVPFAPEPTLAGSEQLAQRREIAAAAGALRGRFASAVMSRPGAVRSYSTLPFVALEVTPDELRTLAADPLVISISENVKLRARLAESAPLIGAPQAWAAGYTGAGQTIAILDTGIDKNHPFLAGKVVSEACYSLGYYCAGATSSTAVGSGLPCPLTSPCAHGTHVAGIAAGLGPSASGIARDANLISIQVFSPDPDYPDDIAAWFSDVLAGLNRVSELRGSYTIAAVNISIGGYTAKRACDTAYPAMTAAIANLRSAGIATIVASGNEGKKDAIAFPACISKAVSVGAVSDAAVGNCDDRQPMTTDKVACYSNGASFLSVLAPGSLITSSVPGGGYESWSGTSMAAPHVAGAWAVMRQRYPDAPAAEILAAFQASGRMVTDYRTARSRKPIVKPRVDVAAALGRMSRLSVVTAGTGSGTVSIVTPRGGTTVCGSTCAFPLASGTIVKLTARPARGSRFVGWSGGPCGKGRCSFSLSGTPTVTATFIAR